MKSKLNLDPKVVDSARQHAANIAHDMQEFIERHTTVSTERTIVRLLGVDGVDDVDTPPSKCGGGSDQRSRSPAYRSSLLDGKCHSSDR